MKENVQWFCLLFTLVVGHPCSLQVLAATQPTGQLYYITSYLAVIVTEFSVALKLAERLWSCKVQ